jgi:hypothetical protein
MEVEEPAEAGLEKVLLGHGADCVLEELHREWGIHSIRESCERGIVFIGSNWETTKTRCQKVHLARIRAQDRGVQPRRRLVG